jgi:trans-aconitate 2-methyltransferase
MPTWDAAQYLRFAEQRTRPCRDLAERVNVASPQRVIDLGCGPGNSTAVLAKRWPGAQIVGVDSSPQMIEAAQKDQPTGRFLNSNIETWATSSSGSFDVVFSNAALQWVDDHERLFPRLFAHVAPGGALAVQIPGNYDGPAHRASRELAASAAWRDRFKMPVREWHVHDLSHYYDFLAPHAAALDLWETEYLHVMPNAQAIVEWYKGTGLRPFLEALADDADRAAFLDEYLLRIGQAYPPRSDGHVLFPFRRLFIVAYRAV